MGIINKNSGFITLNLRDKKVEEGKYPILDADLSNSEMWGIEGMLSDIAYIFKPLLLEDDNCIELHMMLFNSTCRIERKISINSTVEDIIKHRNSMLGEVFEYIYPLWSVENPNEQYVKPFLDMIEKRNGK